MSDRRDLTGIWYGRYDAEHPMIPPNSFIAALDEIGGALGGSITEPDMHGRPEILRAIVTGRRSGSAVRFVKQYDGAGGLTHAVFYAGEVDGEGTQVAGEWRFASYSGSFVITRERFDVAELEAERVEVV